MKIDRKGKTDHPDPFGPAHRKFAVGGDRARIKWLIEFAQREDVPRLTPKELDTLDDEIFWFAAGRQPAFGFEAFEPKSTAEIFQLQESLRSGLRYITKLDERMKGMVGWEVDLAGVVRFVRRGFLGYRGPRPAVFRAAASELIGSPEGERILECPHCERVFVKEGRMGLCTKRCAASARQKAYRNRQILKEERRKEEQRKDRMLKKRRTSR